MKTPPFKNFDALVFLVVGAIAIGYGAMGIVQGRITLGGTTRNPIPPIEGPMAVWISVAAIVAGLISIALGCSRLKRP